MGTAFGGFGPATRMWGLNCDLIQSMEVVRDDGTLEDISENSNTDLFWVRIQCLHSSLANGGTDQAMRGAAPSFAIATALTYDTKEEIPKDNIHPIEFHNWMYYDVLAEALQNFQKNSLVATDYAPKELSVDLIVEPAGLGPGPSDFVKITVRGVYYGSKEKYKWINEYLESLFGVFNTKQKGVQTLELRGNNCHLRVPLRNIMVLARIITQLMRILQLI